MRSPLVENSPYRWSTNIMTHTIYSHQQLRHKSLAQLKHTYSEIGCTVEVRDRRRRAAWINAFVEDVGAAIAQHQAAQLQKIARHRPVSR
ncbi:MAG: hypothetical protein RMX96_35030 [Nostoc sp. ChiSLP02]|nr:hypothetical protein [Nostoc sp. DedSLP05]MDZ8101646.1 hypothetical protein [Nostoc sp. DedSLP01]MDZ8190037.1 hypothetical protein [Nostoc sp. ChiSLP02]